MMTIAQRKAVLVAKRNSLPLHNYAPYADYTVPVIPGASARTAIPPRDYKTIAQRTLPALSHGKPVLTHHGLWWSFPNKPEEYDELFKDRNGNDRRVGDGTLRD